MIIAGINLGSTRFSKSIKNGGSCILVDGQIKIAVGEERISRIKYDAGFNNSLKHCLSELNLQTKDIDLVVISSCCEGIRTIDTINPIEGVSRTKCIFVNHHLSHAHSAFFLSPFEKSIIVVADGGGNTLNSNSSEWWKIPREQNSYYIGEGDKIKLIGRDFDKPFDTGLGELYRYVSHYLGWHSSDAGKVMSLAAFGNPNRFSNSQLIEFNKNSGKLHSLIRNEPYNQDQFINFLFKEGFGKFTNKTPEESLNQDHKDIAYFVQEQVSQALINKITYLSNKNGAKNLCFAGGVALNCVINERIIKETPITNIFIQPAAGDQGQCLGNALFGGIYTNYYKNNQTHFSPYLGKEHNWDNEVPEAAQKYGVSFYRMNNFDMLVYEIANQIANGLIIGWVQGRSEIGPRALGNRSILADPRKKVMKDKLNTIKKRDSFMPIAPSVMEEHVQDYFETDTPSPYMLRAIRVKSNTENLVPAIVHSDKTSRIQTVNKFQNHLFYQLLEAFNRISGIPILCNTSFNGNMEPIVENADDAINSFLRIGLDKLVIGNWILELK